MRSLQSKEDQTKLHNHLTEMNSRKNGRNFVSNGILCFGVTTDRQAVRRKDI